MHSAWTKDIEAISSQRPAVNKLLVARHLYQDLKPLEVRDKFLELGGLDAFAMWLDVMVSEDGTERQYPNINIVQGVLEYLRDLPVDYSQIKECKIYSALDKYQENREVHLIARKLAKEILNKWQLLLGGKVGYDEEYDHEEGGYNRLQKNMDKFRQEHESSSDDEESKDEGSEGSSSDSETSTGEKKEVFKKPSIPASKIQPISLQGEIKRTREGVLLPTRNAFEFVLKPASFETKGSKKGGAGQETGKQKLMKSLLKLKRSNTSALSANKHMAVVKYEN